MVVRPFGRFHPLHNSHCIYRPHHLKYAPQIKIITIKIDRQDCKFKALFTLHHK